MKPALQPAVLSVTKFHAGSALNIGPEEALIEGSCRYFDGDFGEFIEAQLQGIAADICHAFGASCSFSYNRQYPPLVNAPGSTDIAVEVAVSLVGEQMVNAEHDLIMGSEDFAFMLQASPGAYILLGTSNGENDPSGPPCALHNPGYDFNDQALSTGASYWISLAEKLMPVSQNRL